MTAGKIKWTTGRVTQSASANPLVDILGINPPSEMLIYQQFVMFDTFKKTVLYRCIVYHYSLKLPYILLRKIVMASQHLETAGCREMIVQDAIRVVVSDLLISIRERGFFPSLCNQRRSASVNVAGYDI